MKSPQFLMGFLVAIAAVFSSPAASQATPEAARAAIELRLDELEPIVGNCPSTNPERSTRDGWVLICDRGRIYSRLGTGVHEVHGRILQQYLAQGGPGENSRSGNVELGYPISDELRSIDTNMPGSHFELGSLYMTEHGVLLYRTPVLFEDENFAGRYERIEFSNAALCKQFRPRSYFVPPWYLVDFYARCNFETAIDGRCGELDGLPVSNSPPAGVDLSDRDGNTDPILARIADGPIVSVRVDGVPLIRSSRSTESGVRMTTGPFGHIAEVSGRSHSRTARDLTISENGSGRSLVLTKIIVIDNDEGSTGGLGGLLGHGPVGNLHLLVYDGSRYEEFANNLNRKNYPSALAHLILVGPTKREFDDGDIQSYEELEIFRWRSEDDSVVVLIYESDPDSGGFFTARKHDGVFLAKIDRQDVRDGPLWLHSCTQERCEEASNKAIERALERNRTNLITAIRETGIWSGGIGRGLPEVFTEFTSSNRPSEFGYRNRPRCPKFDN